MTRLFYIFISIYLFILVTNHSEIMSTILTKEYDDKQSKYTYNISNLYSVPLFIALRFAFIIMSYVLVCLFIESIAYAHKVDLNLPK